MGGEGGLRPGASGYFDPCKRWFATPKAEGGFAGEKLELTFDNDGNVKVKYNFEVYRSPSVNLYSQYGKVSLEGKAGAKVCARSLWDWWH